MDERIHRPDNDNRHSLSEDSDRTTNYRIIPYYASDFSHLSMEELDEEDDFVFNHFYSDRKAQNHEYQSQYKEDNVISQTILAPKSSEQLGLARINPDTKQQEQSQPLNVANLSATEKLAEAMKRAALLLPKSVGEQLNAMVNPTSLTIMVGVLGAYAASHAVGVGVIADAVMAVGAGATIGWQAVSAGKDLWGFAQFINATTEEDLDKCGQHLANFVATVGIDVVLGVLVKKAAGKASNYGDDLNRVDEVHAHSDDVNKIPSNTNNIYPEGINFDTNQPNHLANLDGFKQQKGVAGAHNLDAFNQAVNQYKLKIVRKDKHPTIEGIYEIEYQVPKKNKQGQYTGDYRTPKNPLIKTVYDPKVISDVKILEWGQQAAAQGYKNAITQQLGIYDETVNGLDFRIYLDLNTGKIRNVHPQ